MTNADLRRATADELAGMTWWNAQSEADRRYWMRRAGDTGIAADAWLEYQRTQEAGAEASFSQKPPKPPPNAGTFGILEPGGAA